MKFEGNELANLSFKEMLPYRREIQMIFQDPYSSLNPRHTVGTIVGTPMMVHKTVPKKDVLNRVQELLETVGLNPEHYNRYPERVLRRTAPTHRHRPVARAQPETDRRRRAGIGTRRLDPGAGRQPAADLQDEFQISFLFIAHDLAIVRHFCPQIAVMYLGKIVEIGDREADLHDAAPPVHAGIALGRARRQAGGDRRTA